LHFEYVRLLLCLSRGSSRLANDSLALRIFRHYYSLFALGGFNREEKSTTITTITATITTTLIINIIITLLTTNNTAKTLLKFDVFVIILVRNGEGAKRGSIKSFYCSERHNEPDSLGMVGDLTLLLPRPRHASQACEDALKPGDAPVLRVQSAPTQHNYFYKHSRNPPI